MSLSQKTIKLVCEVNKSQLGDWQDYVRKPMLIMLQRKEEAQKHGPYAKTSRPKSICIYLLIIHLEISIQNISLVLSCESHPKCKLKATDNCIKELCVKKTILAPASTSTVVFPLVATTHPLDSCFCHSS